MPDSFRYHTPIAIRFADLDALGHVNHAMFFTYMESARMGYMREVLGWSGDVSQLALILAKAECEYKLPLVMADSLSVEVAVTRLGGSSFDMAYRLIKSGDEAIAAVGKTVLVVFDYATNTSTPIPEEWRAAMQRYEPGLTTS